MTILADIKNSILTLTLNRPEKRNALNEDMLKLLQQSLDAAKSNPSIQAVLLTGQGPSFCAGADIQTLKHCDSQGGYTFAHLGQTVFRQLETLGKPSLAAINGLAFGGGCELAMAASIRFAADDAQFAQPEIKLGLIPGYGGTQRLARLIGKGRAIELCLTGRSIDAHTAERWGLVSLTYPKDILLSKAYDYLEGLTQGPSHAYKSLLDTIDRGYDLTLEDACQLEALQFSTLCATQDKTEGVCAFLEKRRPHFKGQ